MDTTLQVAFAPLALEPKTFNVGDTIRVTASFVYTVAADTLVTVQAGPYHYIVGILDRIGASFGKATVDLPMALTPTEKQFTVDFKLSGIDAGTYGLIVEIPGTDINVKQDDVLIVAAAPSVFEMIGPLLVIGLMAAMVSMMAPMMEEGFS
jgi:hypothetical protein